jgi:hypothetical protein
VRLPVRSEVAARRAAIAGKRGSWACARVGEAAEKEKEAVPVVRTCAGLPAFTGSTHPLIGVLRPVASAAAIVSAVGERRFM